MFVCITSLNAQWEHCNKGLGGYEINSFVTDCKNTYVGIDGGAFITTDNGDNWIAKINRLKGYPGFNIFSLAINGNNIFAGTDCHSIYKAKLSGPGITDVKETKKKMK